MYLSLVSLVKGAKLEVFIFLIILTFVLVFVILNALERKLNQKLSTKIDEKDIVFVEIDKLGVSDEPSEVIIGKIDQIARDVFEKEMGISKSLGYLELINLFAKKSNQLGAQFSNNMLHALYSGKSVDRVFINDLILDLETIINKEREQKKFL